MMEAAPPAPFIMPEPDLLLELLIIALDAPAQLGGVDQIGECDAARQGRKPILGRLLLALGPLDQQPFFGRFAGLFMARCNVNTQPRKPRGQPFISALPPLDCTPSSRPQSEGEVLDRDRIGRVMAPFLRCPDRPLAWLLHQRLRLNAGHVALSKVSDARAQLGIVAICGAHQRHAARKADLTGPADLFERKLRLGLERDLLGDPVRSKN
jgi:hypothetical protein